MYAQLCKRLSEEAPNFEPPDQPCTFKLLLLNKCRTEFENRAQAFAAFDDKATLSPEDEEKRHLAKCKMLGNIKFIGELGKLEILAESILHRCIQNLLARRAAAEHHEDLECLAQLVRTCGRVLDSERGRGLMDQYFARIETLSRGRDLASRIRFMLRDVVELRRGGWVPRAAVAGEGPVPMAQLRDDEQPRREPLFRRARPIDEVLASLHLPASSPGSHGSHGAHDDKLFSNGMFRQRAGGGPPYARQPPLQFSKPAAHAAQHPPAPGKARVPPPTALADLQMRPAANSLMFTANRLSRPQPQPPPQQSVLAPAFATPPPVIKEPAITIKPASDKKDKPKKDKGMSKEEACKLMVEAVDAVQQAGAGAGDDGSPPAALQRLQELHLPDKVLRRAIAAALEHALAGAAPAAVCRVVRRVKRAPLHEPLRALLHAPGAARARLPALLAHAVHHKLLALAELAAWCEGGQHHPLLLEVLQELRALCGPDRLRQLYDESKVDLCAYASACAGAGEAGEGGEGEAGDGGSALEALEARGLGALVPQLRVRAALARQLAAEPAPQPLYRWIKANVEPAVRGTGAFVSALVALVCEHVTGEAARGEAGAPDREKALVESYAPLLRALLDRPELQLAAVYAVQVHAHRLRYPKGMLLRWFMYLYNLEVCEEDAFLRWREDVTDAYPGKGEALFQVNAWLTWLQQQDSEDDDADD